MKYLKRATLLGLSAGMSLAIPIHAYASEGGATVLADANNVQVVQRGQTVEYRYKHSILEGAGIADVPGVSSARVIPSEKTLKGQKVGIGDTAVCKFTESGSSPRPTGGTVTVSREISFNLETCESTLEVAAFPADQTTMAAIQKVSESDQQSETSSTGEAVAPAATTRNYYGSLKVNVEDPPQIDVTTTRSEVWVRKRSDRKCISSDLKASWGWYSPTGWQRTNASWTNSTTCTAAEANTLGKYKNTKFCATIDTRTDHSKTYMKVTSTGGWSWSYKVTKSGGCNWLLHYEKIVTTP